MKKLLVTTLATGLVFLSNTMAAVKPNIVFIMADDLGPGWVDLDGSHSEINTPNLEKLARDGMVFTRAYAAAPVCSPTRASCITGMSPAQVQYTTHAPGMGQEAYMKKIGGLGSGDAIDAESRAFLPSDVPSYARELKKLGYLTAFFGKWHLAGEGSTKTKDGVLNSAWHPEHYGFDSNLGGCAYGQPKSWFDPYKNGTIPNRKKGEYLTDRLGDEAAAYITANAKNPFHVTLWLYSVHTPIKAPSPLVNKNGGNAYLAMLESMDAAVGKVLDALKNAGIAENTLVVFYSDNGGDKPTKGLGEKKGSLLEGGLRVPMVVRWPGIIRGGTRCDIPVTSPDFFPTFVYAAGGDTENVQGLEGEDLLPLFQGVEKLDRDGLYWHFPHHRKGIKYAMGSAMLKGDWKFYQGYGKTGDALFNLKNDPEEESNVLASNPEVAEKLRGRLNQWLSDGSANMPRTEAEF